MDYRVNQNVVDLHENNEGAMRIARIIPDGLWCITERGKQVFRHRLDVRPQDFLEFCFQRSGFGKTPWVEFAFIQAGIVAMSAAGLYSGYLFTVLFGAGIEALLVYATHQNWTGRWV